MKRIRHIMAGFALAGACGAAHAQTGVSDDRVSLPEGPGSLEGVGENISLNPNMGVMSYGVPIDVPQGFPGVTPDLRLAYSSGGGSGLVGVGWRMAVPHIERSTFKGLPRYTADDRFTADGGTQLVRLPGETAVYRARYEGDFIRYTWLEVGDGSEGYWQAEYPDGRIATFGASADGTLVPAARVSGPDGTFRYMVVDVIDVHGHRLTHTYQSIDGYALIRQMDYVFTTDAPEYSVSFNYEDRADDTGVDILSDAKAGFDERLTQRLSAINVFSGENRIRRYELGYERYVDSGGFTRLSSVATIGLDGSTYPAVQQFGWSENLGEQTPFVIDMGNIGVNIGVGRATFIDINGDALPDLVDTSDDGAHQFLLNIPSVDGVARFSDVPVASSIGQGSGFRLGTPFVQVLDVNGDGFADLLDARNGRALINDGSGDWARLENLGGTGEVSDALGAGFDADDGSLSTLRFMDIDNDKRIDLVRSSRESTRIWRNAGANGFEVLDDIDLLGYDIAVDGIQMSDMNGDGLLDAVKLNVGGLRYRLNLGHGRWGDEVEVLGLPLDESELDLASLDDLNGDGLSDLVVVVGRQVKFAINRNGTVFSQITTLGSDDVEGEVPLRDGTVSVLMADVNGNGSTDVVWLDAQGQVTALELFPVRPNQLARIANSLGMVTEIAYTTSVQEMARDGDWAYTLPHPMQVVASTTQSDGATGIREITRYRYRDGYYDGEEKQFRGFGHVEMRTEGDEFSEAGRTVATYDLGVEDRYRHGRLLTQALHSDDRLLNTVAKTYADCALSDVPATEPAIRFICETESTTTVIEGTDAAEHVTLRKEMQYNGYGNVILDADHGVVAVGGGACAPCADDVSGPCGADCLGDELYTETDFIEPGDATGGAWFVGVPARVSTYGDPNSDLKTEKLMYYDGPAFEGLPNGQLTRGTLTRTTRKVSDTEVIAAERYRRDDDGNVIESLDPNATLNGQTHRTRYTIDADGLRVTRTEIALEDPNGQPYSLARSYTYEPVFDQIASAVDWQIFDATGDAASPVRTTTYTYDTFNRLTSITRPGDRPDAPSEVFEYDLQEGASRIIARRRSTADGPLDIEQIRCMDGRGRLLQERNRIAEGRYMVSGLSIYNVAGHVVRRYQPFDSASAECDMAEPADVLFTATVRDATNRELRSINPDAGIHGTASESRSVFTPLAVTTFDFEDADPDSPHFETPRTTHRDGLDRVIAVERTLADGTRAITRNLFDGLSRIVGIVDAAGNVKRQSFDLLDRVITIDDPNKSGQLQMAYDAAGNLLSSDDGSGVRVHFEYDGVNRLVARFDAADPVGSREETVWDVDPGCDPSVCTNTAGMRVKESSPRLTGEGRNIANNGYDARGRPLLSERVLEGVPMRLESVFDNADRLVRMVYPDGQAVDYRHDGAGRVIALDGIIDAVTYDARGDVERIAYANGTQNTFVHDDMALLRERAITGPAGEALQSVRYTRDRAGNVLQIEDQGAGLPRGATFEYDAWYRLIADDHAAGAAHTLTYDALSNITARSGEGDATGLMGAFRYANGVNAVSQAGAMTFEYDSAGQTVAAGDQTLSWDAMGRLRSVSRAGETAARYAYDRNEFRVARQEGDSLTLYGARTWELRDGISHLYVTLGSDRVARLESAALATTALTDLAPLDSPDAHINAADAWAAEAHAQGLLELDTAPSAPGALLNSAVRRMFTDAQPQVWLHQDHLGSIVMATDPAGAVVGERSFGPTGVEHAGATGFVDAYGFTGQQHDRATGLVYFHYRMLNPQTGRWMSPDPFFKRIVETDVLRPCESLNVYGYARNNYANRVDPNGLFTKFIKRKLAARSKRIKTRRQAKATRRAARKRLGQIHRAVNRGNYRALTTKELRRLINNRGKLPDAPPTPAAVVTQVLQNAGLAAPPRAQAPEPTVFEYTNQRAIENTRVSQARTEIRRRAKADLAQEFKRQARAVGQPISTRHAMVKVNNMTTANQNAAFATYKLPIDGR